MLLLTILPICVYAKNRTTVHIRRGGTDVEHAPTINYLREVLLPILARMGMQSSLQIQRYGYYPKGMGEATLTVNPSQRLLPIQLEDFGNLSKVQGLSVCTFLKDRRVADRQALSAEKHLRAKGFAADIKVREMSEEQLQLGPITVDWQEQVYHPGGSVRYRLSTNGKKIVYATDVELDRAFEGTNREKGNQAQDYRDFIADADLLIGDGQYTQEEYPDKVGWGHTSIPVLLDNAFRSGVKKLAIFHHDPQHSDKFLDEIWSETRSRFRTEDKRMEVFCAREGMTIAV